MVEINLDEVRYSYSSLSTYRHCAKQFEYRYIKQLESKSDKWKSVKDLGTAIHDGIAELLSTLVNEELSVDQQIAVAMTSALDSHDKLVDKEKVAWHGERDDDYYAKMAYNRDIIPQLVKMYIPMMELGTRYRPALASEFGIDTVAPLVEFPFLFYDTSVDGRKRPIEGIIDSVLYDIELDEYILYDWKVRGRLLDETNVDMDMQLPLYATFLNVSAFENDVPTRINRVRMFQMLKTPPKPAVLTKKQVPSRAVSASYWDYWWESIPAPLRKKLNKDEWFNEMSEKLRQKEDWIKAVDIIITPSTMEEVSLLVENTLDQIENSAVFNKFIPIWSAHGCEFCQFKHLCKARRDGIDEQFVIDELYNVVE